MTSHATIKFIDLFAGIGGIRKGFELACAEKNLPSKCVFTSEIKPYAIDVLKQNHPGEVIHGDITQIDANDIPDFDFLLAGFPCQAFSAAGKRMGFEDTRGTLFFEVARIIKVKKPFGFVLENVEGLVNHDKDKPNDKIGKTLTVIIETLEEMGYKVSWKVLNAKFFGVPQERKRIYIVGTKVVKPDLERFKHTTCTLESVLEHDLPVSDSKFIKLVLRHYPLNELYGKSIKDKRGGNNNIHSWDIEYKGSVSHEQANLLNSMLKERRKKKWADQYGIDWMDGMPITLEHIRTFYRHENLEEMLSDLVKKGYLKQEYPKRKVGNKRIQDSELPLGYNIVTGKMSFEISKVLDPKNIAPTLVAMDMQHLFVVDGDGLRTLSLREGLRLFGYPDDFKFDTSQEYGYDLLGNTVVVPVIKEVATRALNIYCGEIDNIPNFVTERVASQLHLPFIFESVQSLPKQGKQI
ncbi:MAG: DNA cytosine methyltransferase [Victivallales bacterium]|jgi:DNA (cytosine-5)-methyltransferase 1|nr:DNA cytosine methyltransferase [Victivallales bacterium]